MKRITIHQVTLIAIVAVPAVTVCGCTGDRVATVSGTITFKGKPMPGGTITFVSEDRTKQEMVAISANGTYTASRVPWGNVLIGIQPVAKKLAVENKAPKDKGFARPQAEGQYVDIPDYLQNPATSKITLNVDANQKPFDIPLPDK